MWAGLLQLWQLRNFVFDTVNICVISRSPCAKGSTNLPAMMGVMTVDAAHPGIRLAAVCCFGLRDA
jgi:hypothetical protein